MSGETIFVIICGLIVAGVLGWLMIPSRRRRRGSHSAIPHTSNYGSAYLGAALGNGTDCSGFGSGFGGGGCPY